MSDISKKIFSIDPEPDEDPIGDIPPLPEDPEADPTSQRIAETEPDPDTDRKTLPRSRIQLRPVDDLTDRDIVSSIRASAPPLNLSEPVDDLKDDQPIEPASETRPASTPQNDIIRPITAAAMTEPGPSPSLVAAVAPRSASQPYVAEEPKGHAFGWIGFILTLLTALGIGLAVYLLFVQDRTLTLLEITVLSLVALVPAATVGTLWAALRTLSRVSSRSQHLAVMTDRLTHVDDAVAADVTHMAAAIRRELAGVDQSLNQTRSHLLTITEQAAVQGAELTGMSRSAAEHATAIDAAITSHREQFRTLLSDFEIRLQSLSQSVERHATLLETAGSDSAARIETVTQALGQSMAGVSERGQEISDHVQSADAQLKSAEERLSILSEQIADRTAQLDNVYERRADHLGDLSARIKQETASTDSVLAKQSEQLAAIDSHIEATEQRLTALLDHARGIQSQLIARLSDMDSTLSEADRRSRSFTADMSDRVNDSIAQTRRELSIMESELRALQSRMQDQPDLDLGLNVTPPQQPDDSPRRIRLQPLDTDFPPVEPQPLDIPETPDDDLFDLVEVVETPDGDFAGSAPTTQDDVVRRPGADSHERRSFGQPKRKKPSIPPKDGGWRWRDMLGGIDPLDQPADDTTATPSAPPRQGVERPPAGVPLSPPSSSSQAPSDGSDVVARLCEVQLAPSAIVDEGTIYEAAAIRRASGEEAQNACVEARLEGPVLHLREVLREDLEFKLRAESFRRVYADTLDTIRSEDALQAKLGSATGRAYLLCAAALITA